MTDRSPNQPIDAWVLGYLDGTLGPADFARLTQAMRSDPAVLDRFVELASLDRSLLESLTHGDQVQAMQHATLEQADPALSFEATLALLGQGSENAQLVHLHTDLQPRQRVMPYLIGGAIAALFTLAVTLTFVFSGGPTTSQDITSSPSDTPTKKMNTVATLTKTHNAQWAERALARGSQLHPGDRYTLTAGFAEITTARGAIAILEAPVTIELLNNDNALRLHAGKMVGICETDASKGFLVRTPQTDITDLGTRFGIDASSPSATEVHVFEGEVLAVSNPSDQARATTSRLTAGQSAVVSDHDDRIRAIAYNPSRFAAVGMQTLKLPGTGVGLSGGDTDPNYRVITVDGQQLDTPIAMRCKTYSTDRGVNVVPPNDPATGQWITFYYPETDAKNQTLRYTVEVNVTIPHTVDLSSTQLDAVLQADNALAAMRVNGKPVRHPGVVSSPHKLLRLDDTTLAELGIRHGQNTVQFDIENDRGSVSGLHLRWHLVDASDPELN